MKKIWFVVTVEVYASDIESYHCIYHVV